MSSACQPAAVLPPQACGGRRGEVGHDAGMSGPTELVNEIAEPAQQHGFAIGAAESLTGGAISSALAQGAAASQWYHGCVVSYPERVTFDLLGSLRDPSSQSEPRSRWSRALLGCSRPTRSSRPPEPVARTRRRGIPGTVYVGVLVPRDVHQPEGAAGRRSGADRPGRDRGGPGSPAHAAPRGPLIREPRRARQAPR